MEGGSSTASKVKENIKHVKSMYFYWVEKRLKRDKDNIVDIEKEILVVYDYKEGVFLNVENRDALIRLESRGKAILEVQEASWRIKSRSTWLEGRDENKKFFQDYDKGRKMCNTIWNLQYGEGREVSNFELLASLGWNHF